MCAATATALSPEEQKRLTVPPGTVTGSPASNATFRPTLNPCGPSGKPVPMTTSSISAGSSWGTFRRTSFTQCAAMSSGRVRLNDPRNDLARPVRELATMTASRMGISFVGWCETRMRYSPVQPARDSWHPDAMVTIRPVTREDRAAVLRLLAAQLAEHAIDMPNDALA